MTMKLWTAVFTLVIVVVYVLVLTRGQIGWLL